MKSSKFAKVFFAILLFSSLIQSQWFRQNSGVTTNLNSVFFTDQNTGIIAANSGKILRTTNGGINWNVSLVSDTSIYYNSICFPNSSTGYISGRIIDLLINMEIKPIIIKTTNSGANWFSVLNDTGYTLKSVYFINSNTGYATGGLFAVGPNYLLTTTNGGTTWFRNSPGNGYLYTMAFKDAYTGYMTGVNGLIYRSTNFGFGWAFIMGIPSVYALLSMNFVDANLGFMTGGNSMGTDSSGNIYKTINGGNNWNMVYNDHKGMINCVKFVSSNIGYAAGTVDIDPYYSIPSRIIKTTNTGNGWYIDTLFSNVYGLRSIYFTDLLTGYVVGSNGVILKTTTGGNLLGIVPVSTNIPGQFSLSQNYPNPFNPVTTIKFSIPREGVNVRLVIYDALGNEVQVLVHEQLKAGEYKVTWDGTGYSSGIYFYKLQALAPSGDGFIDTKKLVLLK